MIPKHPGRTQNGATPAPAALDPERSAQESGNQAIKMLFDAYFQRDKFRIGAAMRHLVFLDDMKRLQRYFDGLTPSGGSGN